MNSNAYTPNRPFFITIAGNMSYFGVILLLSMSYGVFKNETLSYQANFILKLSVFALISFFYYKKMAWLRLILILIPVLGTVERILKANELEDIVAEVLSGLMLFTISLWYLYAKPNVKEYFDFEHRAQQK